MNIIGIDALAFGVDDLDACAEFCTAFGLKPVNVTDEGGSFEALDGTSFIVRKKDDIRLPSPLPTATTLRQTVYGVKDQAVLDAIESEISKDREIHKNTDGSLEFQDDSGVSLKFQITIRRSLDMPAEKVNAPGAPVQRAVNVVGANEDADALPRELSHVVYFVPDVEIATKFYTERLNFVITDQFTNAGPFLRPQGNGDHHCLFLIQTPAYMQGIEHVAFHMQGPTELMLAGSRMVGKGFPSFWGPGRHKFGSNWFWYFNSPFGCRVEYDADMDKHDNDWKPRSIEMSPGAAQMYLFEHREKWAPGGDDH